MPVKIKLTKQQEQELKRIKQSSHSELVRDRAHAVLLRSHGQTAASTAKALMRSRDFVNQAVKRFQGGELQKVGLNSNNRRISADQREEIIKLIQEKCPSELPDFKFKEQFWTTDILRTVLKKKHKIEYKTDKSYYDLFKAAGFSFHKPKTKDFRQDPEKARQFKGALKKSSSKTRIRLSW